MHFLSQKQSGTLKWACLSMRKRESWSHWLHFRLGFACSLLHCSFVHVHPPVGLTNIVLLLTGEELAAVPAPGVRVGEEVEEVVLLLLLPLLLLPRFSVLLLEEEVLEAVPVPGVRGELE